MESPLSGFSTPSPLTALRAPDPAATGKRLSTSASRPSAAPAPRSSASFAPAFSVALSPAAHKSLLPAAASSPAPRLPALSSPPSDSLASTLPPSAAPATAPRALRPLRDWGAVLAPPPPASVSGLVSSLAMVSLLPGGG